MKQVPDRKKLRREYLDKKFDLCSQMVMSSIYSLPFIGILFWIVFDYRNLKPRSDQPKGSLAYEMGFTLVLIILVACVIFYVWAQANRVRELKALPYVPPVIHDNLPAEEILVRGSEEPPDQQSEVLLRAAKEQETPKEELLRVAKE